MKFTEIELKGAYIIEIEKIEDERGFFVRSYCEQEFNEIGLNTKYVQSSISFNKEKGTLRGMHLQLAPDSEIKLVRCVNGAIFDVIVDLRKESVTFKKWISVELTQENRICLYVPKGFAHGFITLKDNTEVNYQMSEYYKPFASHGFRYDDPTFKIQWPIAVTEIAEKDKAWPDFKG